MSLLSSSGIPAPTPPQHPFYESFSEYLQCPQHRMVILALCGLLQAITLGCPGALVWHNFGESKSNSVLCGSPLDLLPCAPSSLPMPPGMDNQYVSIPCHSRAQHAQIFHLLRFFDCMNFKHIAVFDIWTISCGTALKWMPQNLTDDESSLVRLMAWCYQVTNHHMSPCWPKSVTICCQ